jgi:anti-sigma regulatory factor (Ser/Thr protein kinase)
MPDFALPLPGSLDAPSVARTAVFGFLSEQGYDEGIASDVLLAVSELVTNAVVHGRPPRELRVSSEPIRLRVEVRDADPGPGSEAVVAVLGTGGRGLAIVAAVADATGVERHLDGKVAWASWHLPTP